MKPGVELDALIAKHVMGWKPSDYNRKDYLVFFNHSGQDIVILEDGIADDLCFRPSIFIKDAWEALEMLREDGWAINISCAWEVEIYKRRGDCFCERSDYAPHAICLAALKVKGVEIEG